MPVVQSAETARTTHQRDTRHRDLGISGGIDFTAIIALNNCSGALVRFSTSLGSDPAMVLTNGHCYEGGFLQPGEVLQNVPSKRSFKLLSADGETNIAVFHASKVLYATLTSTDVTLYELTDTFDQIEKRYGVTALTMSAKHPQIGQSIAIASGYWRHIYHCSVDAFIYELHEDAYTFRDSIRYTQPGCNTIPGTSGSPIIDAETREVVAINNTGNENGERCTMDNPCEVDSAGNITVVPKASYGEQTYLFYGCLGPNNQIDLSLSGCKLPKSAGR
jgi:hypothetical protein